MSRHNTDQEWEKFGKAEPYFGVLADEKYLTTYLDNELKKNFFQTGYDYRDHVLANIRKHLDSKYTPKQALDFGCGVGRLVIPLAEVANHVTGIDVSDSMLKEAQRNAEKQSLRNISFLKSDDELSQLDQKYDFIHSFIVFQHLSPKRGEKILKTLISFLKDNGCGVLHFLYAKDYSSQKIITSVIMPIIKKRIPLARNLINVLRGRDWFAPFMEMNHYNLNRLFSIIQKNDIKDMYVEYTNHGGDLGLILYFRKDKIT